MPSYLGRQVSEGLDFSDRAGRAVIITGIPYAVKNDPKVACVRACRALSYWGTRAADLPKLGQGTRPQGESPKVTR
jgi:Rad3-related DNA helicase